MPALNVSFVQEQGPEGPPVISQLLFWRIWGRNPSEIRRSFFGLVFFLPCAGSTFLSLFFLGFRIAFAVRRRMGGCWGGGTWLFELILFASLILLCFGVKLERTEIRRKCFSAD